MTYFIAERNHDKGAYVVKLENFEGPFDLLFYLISKEKMDIWEVSLAHITNQFLYYLQTMKELEVNVAADYLVMAASLLRLKSNLLLPNPSYGDENEESEFLMFGSKEELVHSLLEYRRFKLLAQKLKEREKTEDRIYLRFNNYSYDQQKQNNQSVKVKQMALVNHSADTLKLALKQLYERKIEREKEKKLNLPEDVSFFEKLKQILNTFKEKTTEYFYLKDFLLKKNKEELVLTFFTLLELARRGEIILKQNKIFGTITIFKKSE